MLRRCPECSNNVSDTAELCPKCGYRLLGRRNLVRCTKCNQQVIPVVNPFDTISKYCPLCNAPITNLVGRKVFFVLALLFAAFVVAMLLFTRN